MFWFWFHFDETRKVELFSEGLSCRKQKSAAWKRMIQTSKVMCWENFTLSCEQQ